MEKDDDTENAVQCIFVQYMYAVMLQNSNVNAVQSMPAETQNCSAHPREPSTWRSIAPRQVQPYHRPTVEEFA